MIEDKHSWWTELRHGGMLISPAVLREIFPVGYEQPNAWKYRVLRDKYLKFEKWWNDENRSQTQLAPVHSWLDSVFEDFLETNQNQWIKGSKISPEQSITTLLGERIKPNRIYYKNAGDETPSLVMFIDSNQKLGFGKSRKEYGKVLEYLRTRKIKLAIFTNGYSIRLCYAGLDNDSFVEWDTSNWFSEGELATQLFGFYTLLGKYGFDKRDKIDFPLLKAIEDSRTRQGELSTVLGEQVRQSIEILLNQFGQTRLSNTVFTDSVKNSSGEEDLSAIFQAAVRIVMRLVVLLFAEARDLLPKSNELYHNHYGIEGLFEQLRKAKVGESSDFLEDSDSSWIRFQSLCRIVYKGSHYPDLQITAYGGELFAPGDIESNDNIKRAIALFEDPQLHINNDSFLKILERLKYGKLKIKQGRSSTFIKGPVDFRELRTEFIGMIYEGILDYELKCAQEPMLLLNAGPQPILPLSVLEGLSDRQIKDLFEKIKQEDKTDDEDEAEEEAEEVENEDVEEVVDEEIIEDAEEEEADDGADETEKRAQSWAEKAVEVLGWVRRPRRTQDEYEYQNEKRKRAKNLIKESYNEKDFYITLWGGTRKGTGTFYTKPQLAVPTVRRTLEPLCYTNIDKINYEVTSIVDPAKVSEPGVGYQSRRSIPKRPEEILSIKVCDPACGSGSFDVAALIYITNALYESLVYHEKLLQTEDALRKTLPLGEIKDHPSSDQELPVSPDHENFEALVKAKLKRYVVENCIYGVDLNPTAVELARLSLWIETMDKNLPFEFLDHKIKVGNSLVGAWLDTFQEYPLAAWLREGGDKNHSTSVHYAKGEWTKAIKDRLNDVIKPEMAEVISLRAGQLRLDFMENLIDPIEEHKNITLKYNELHTPDISIFGLEQKAKLYYELLNSESYKNVKNRMDLWCAIWFWPGDKIDICPTPKSFYKPTEEMLSIVLQVSKKYHFFHWEIEFPDVFNPHCRGFDAVIGNPPWEVSKPISKEYFSNLDPIYRTYGKQDALNHQRRLFKSNEFLEYDWLIYNAFYRSMSNYVKNAASPFGDPVVNEDNDISLLRGRSNIELHKGWAQLRKAWKCFTSSNHPFLFQGIADLNTFKMFLETSYHLLQKNGRLGVLTPSSLYSDKATKSLRKLFLENCSWEWLFSFENRKKIFDIDSRFKFNIIIIQKNYNTDFIYCSFMQTDIKSWEDPTEVIEYTKDDIKRLSPNNLSIVEITNEHLSKLISKIYFSSKIYADSNTWKLDYVSEYHLTNDSKLFRKPDWLLNNKYSKDVYGRWLNSENEIMLPIYQGAMFNQFDFCASGYLSGSGNRVKWQKLNWENKHIDSQFYLALNQYNYSSFIKTVSRIQARSTDSRTLIASIIPDYPVGHSIAVINYSNWHNPNIFLAVFLNSFVCDFCLRTRLSGTNITQYILEELPLPNLDFENSGSLLIFNYYSLNLMVPNIAFSTLWYSYKDRFEKQNLYYGKNWALTHHERLRLRCVLDAIVAELYGLDFEDFAWILRDDPSDLKGFWRIDKEKPKELRQTTLTLQAFARLKEVGLDEFIKEDWQFPKEIQEQLGPRFLDWQLKVTPEESWAECEFHAKQILGEEGFKKFMEELESGTKNNSIIKEETAKYKGSKNLNLFD